MIRRMNEMQELEESFRRAEERKTEVLTLAAAYFRALEGDDSASVAAIERMDPALVHTFRGLERELAPPDDRADRASLYGRLHQAVLVLKMNELIGQLLDATCPICALEAANRH